MPRQTLEGTTTCRARISKRDLARIDELFKYIGVHGHISDLIRKGTRLQIFIEEVLRDRASATASVRAAIHTLCVASDRRDRELHAGGAQDSYQCAGEKEASDKEDSSQEHERNRGKSSGD